nr:hypothetical protein Iba_chr11bCG14250 [Ipomoea batatas]
MPGSFSLQDEEDLLWCPWIERKPPNTEECAEETLIMNLKLCGNIFLRGSEYAVVVEFRGESSSKIVESSGFDRVLNAKWPERREEISQSQHGLEGKKVGSPEGRSEASKDKWEREKGEGRDYNLGRFPLAWKGGVDGREPILAIGSPGRLLCKSEMFWLSEQPDMSYPIG